MNTSTNIFLAITNKPLLAFGITQSAFVTSLLAWVGVITPIVGLIAAVFGLVVGYYSMRSSYKKWKDLNRKKIIPKKHNHFDL